MKKVLFLLFSLTSFTAFAQNNDEKGVQAAIDQMFDGMRKADTTLFKSVFIPTSTLMSVGKTKDGLTSVRQESIPQFVASVGKQKPGALDERLSGYEIKIDGELATAWTPYTFYYNQQKSHCGVNAFTLVKIEGKWKIQNIIDTRRKDGCPDLPKP
ncbi:nuclear transport factor 2 family protein [Tellurirhabdus bombi]|uniref:nuclear transport factor 2 family protein n=1 Tax=Tellurirhabdus bombi TaxID=2907205 RepID=UPI001F31C634|nr:nuclear transport factor 2 family protein [Tellurirhabdus bombi]